MPKLVDRPRLEYLRALRDGLELRMKGCSSDQNYAVMARELRTVLVEIDDLTSEQGGTKETGLSDFEKRLRAREQRAQGKGRAEGG